MFTVVRKWNWWSGCCVSHVSMVFFFSLAQQPNAGQGPLMLVVLRSHTITDQSRYDSSGRVISPSQRPLPNNKQHSQETDIHTPVGIEPAIPASERLHSFRKTIFFSFLFLTMWPIFTKLGIKFDATNVDAKILHSVITRHEMYV
jgi:hypothetical protein